jgi:hypothetical protein
MQQLFYAPGPSRIEALIVSMLALCCGRIRCIHYFIGQPTLFAKT